MAKKNGVDPKAVIDMLTRTLFPAPIYQSYGKRIAENNAPFSQNAIPLKDVGLFRKTAPYRLSVKRLGAGAAGVRSPFQASNSSALGAGPPRSRPQHLYLSPRPQQADRRTVYRAGYHARRRSGLL